MDPLAYFITFTTYGTWLHGRDPGSVDRQHNKPGMPWLEPNARLMAAREQAMKEEPYELDHQRREIVLNTMFEVCQHRNWKLHAGHVRTNHVHLVVAASTKPEKVMSDIKAWASRRLREATSEHADRTRWTQHGSTRYINDVDSLNRAIAYVLNEQGTKMSSYPQKTNEPDALATDIL